MPFELANGSVSYGPVINDIWNVDGPPMALRWAAAEDNDTNTFAVYARQENTHTKIDTRTHTHTHIYIYTLACKVHIFSRPAPSFGVNIARIYAEWRSALSLFVAPSSNFIYADVDGHIAYQCTGRIPLRASPEADGTCQGLVVDQICLCTDRLAFLSLVASLRVSPHSSPGSLPTLSTDLNSSWVGWIPFEQLPYVLHPKEGFVTSANNKVIGDGPGQYPHVILNDSDVEEGYRAERIRQLLQAGPKLTTDGTLLPFSFFFRSSFYSFFFRFRILTTVRSRQT